jgi:hypothetical protein
MCPYPQMTSSINVLLLHFYFDFIYLYVIAAIAQVIYNLSLNLDYYPMIYMVIIIFIYIEMLHFLSLIALYD